MYLNLKRHVNEIGSTLSPSWRFCHISVYFLMSLPSKGLISLINHVQYVSETCIKHLACWHVPMSRRLASMLFTQWPFWFSLGNERSWLYINVIQFVSVSIWRSFLSSRLAFAGGQAAESHRCLWPFSTWWTFLKVKPPSFSSLVSHSSAFFRIKVHCHFWLWHDSSTKWPRLRAEST